MIGRLLFGLGAAALLATSGIAASSEPAAYPERSDVIGVEADDTEMEAAKAKAQSTLPSFFARLAQPAAGEGDFAVKFNLTPDMESEFIWAGELQFDAGGKLSGILNNVPLDPRYGQGQRVAIDRSAIIDWGYRKGAVFQGNYTTKVLLDRMPEDQAEAIERSMGW